MGRERELALLTGIFDQCVAEPVASAVLVTGPAGVGKSRIRWEFVRRLQKRGDSVQIWTGRGDPMSVGAPFAMLSQAVASTIGLETDDPLAVRRQKTEGRVARNVPAEDARRVVDFLGELVGVSFPDEESVQLQAARTDPMLMGDQMMRAFLDFVAAECRVQPVMLVLEDLHWGDVPTVRFVDAALRQLADLPFMVLAVARPEIEDLFPRLWAERRVQPLPLPELTAKASEKLVREVLGADVGPESVKAIVERAGGNVFYIEELIRAVAEGQRGAMPESVLAMTQARLDGLEPEARRTLRAASVFGQAFWPSAVAALLGGPGVLGEVNRWLTVLADREFLARRTQSRFAPEEELSFRHALLREAAYAMLTDKDRAVGHKLAAEWLAARGEKEPLVLAQHFELGKDPERAIVHYRGAAEEALEGNDFAALIARAGRGIACGARGEVKGSLMTLELEGHFWRGEHDEVERCGAEALQNLAPGSAPYQRALARLIISRGRRGQTERVLELTGRLVQTIQEGLVLREARGATVFALAHGAAQLLFLGRYEEVEPLVAVADRVAREGGEREDPALQGWADDARSTLAMRQGDMGECVLLMARASRHFLAAGDLRQACVEDGYVGYGYLDLGVYGESVKTLRECLARAQRLSLPHVVASAQHNLGFACAMLGQYEEAALLLRTAITTFAAQADRRLESASWKYLALTHLMAGDSAAAEEEARRGLSLVEVDGPMRAGLLATVASVLLAREKSRAALTFAREAYENVERLGSLDTDDALVRRVYAEALHATGDAARAIPVLAAAKVELLRRASKITSDAWRQSYLENVPEHRRVFALAQEWGI